MMLELIVYVLFVFFMYVVENVEEKYIISFSIVFDKISVFFFGCFFDLRVLFSFIE